MSEHSTSDDEDEERTPRFRLDDLGRKFGKTAAISTVLFFLSGIALVLYAFALPEDSTISIYSLPVIALAGSWAGIWVSLFGYSIWSAWQLRGQSPDQETYHMQRNRALLAFVLGVFALLMPVAIVHGSPRGG